MGRVGTIRPEKNGIPKAPTISKRRGEGGLDQAAFEAERTQRVWDVRRHIPLLANCCRTTSPIPQDWIIGMMQ